MTVNILDKNHVEIGIENFLFLFSYGTPVAYKCRDGVCCTDRTFSKTTTAHLNMWAKGSKCLPVPHNEIVLLVSAVGFI